MHLQWCVKLHLILLQFSYNIRHHFNGDGKLSCLLPIRFKTDLPTKFKTIVVLCLSCNSCNSQLPTSSKNLVASAQFLVTLATSESQFRALKSHFFDHKNLKSSLLVPPLRQQLLLNFLLSITSSNVYVVVQFFFLVQKCFEPVQIFWTSTNFLNQYKIFWIGTKCFNLS